VDCVVALNGAMFVNAAILILAAAVFHRAGKDVTEIQQAYLLLSPLLGTVLAAKLFGIALFCSGQSSTLTGTMAGQIVMEGFLNIRVSPWLRRLVTRLLAIIPAICVIWVMGNAGTFRLLLLSQVVLNLQLPFAIIPLLQFTNDRKRMGTFASGLALRLGGWATALIVVGLNLWLAFQSIADWARAAGPWQSAVWVFSSLLTGGLLFLLGWILAQSFRRPAAVPARLGLEQASAALLAPPTYKRILVPVDHTSLDSLSLRHAAGIAAPHHAKIYLLHVEEGVTSQLYGPESSTAEVEAGRAYLENLVASLQARGIEVEIAIRHGSNPRREIVRYAGEVRPDLVVMGAHGHGGLQDLVFGNTINPVRHRLRVPILVVRE
jgi:manganese transport protein